MSKHTPNPKNPRYITEEAYERLQDTMQRLGDISGIVYNVRTGTLIGGHQRSRVMGIDDCKIEIVKTFSPADEGGTLAVGYAYWQGQRFNYRRVYWDDETAELANLVANKGGGKWDFEALANDFDLELLLEVGFTEMELFGADDALPEADNSVEYVIQVKATGEMERDAIEHELARLELSYSTKKKKPRKQKP